MNYEKFRNIMIGNSDLIPMSLDEIAAEWYVIENVEKRNRIDER
ncbi:hypothetical protein [Bacillus cereus]|nr:hypothetical protein [Bacillus cereus]